MAYLSGRGPNRENTARVARYVLSKIDLLPDHVLVDIGCGDGTLLDLSGCKVRVGVLPTEEERKRLETERPHLQVLRGVVQDQLPIPSETADVVVCNSVLLLLANTEEVRHAISELSRIVKPGGVLYLGEIPAAAARGIDHSSPIRWLRSQLRLQGVRGFVAGLKDLLMAATTKSELIFYPEPEFFVSPETLIELTEACGVQHVWHEENPFATKRWDFLFRKPHENPKACSLP